MGILSIEIPTGIGVLGGIALAVVGSWMLGGLFAPMPRYRIKGGEELPPNDSAEFLTLLQSLVDAPVNRTGRVEVLTNGPCFYEAELAAIRGARRSINLEAYIFQRGKIASRIRDALAERARTGVHVNLVPDAFGSFGVTRSFLRPLIEAGGKVCKYNGLDWYRVTRMDNRTHRELLIVDGRVGFIGGGRV